MDEDRSAHTCLQILVAILAAMRYTRLILNVAVYPAPATNLHDAQVHTFDLSLPNDTRRSTRVRAMPGSASRTSGQGLAPAPRGTVGASDFCVADRGEMLSQDDVGGVASSARDAVADSSYVEETVHINREAAEAIGSDNEDEIPRLHGDTISGTDLQRVAASAERDAVVEPSPKKTRRRFDLRSGGAGSSRAGPA